MNIPDKSDRAAATKFLMAINPQLTTARAEAILDRGSQYNDYVRDAQTTIDHIFNRTIGQAASGYLNAIASNKTDMTPARKEAERQATINSMGGEKQILNDMDRNKNFLDSMGDFLDDKEKAQFNTLVSQVSQIVPRLQPQQYQYKDAAGTVIGATTGEVTNPTTGATGSTGATTGTKLTPPKQSDYATFNEYLAARRDYMANRAGTSGTTGSTGTTGGSTTTTTTSSSADFEARRQEALNYLMTLDVPETVRQQYMDIVKLWTPDTELNIPNIVKAFETIKAESIDPHYQGVADLSLASIRNAQEASAKQRALILEDEQANARAAIEGTQANLEASGLTFSGKGIEQLGTGLAATVPFGGQSIEGYVPKKNRLISTSSEAEYQRAQRAAGLEAEQALGSSRTSGLIPGYTPVGGVVGSLEEAKQGDYGAALSSVLDQQIANKAQLENTDYTPTA